MKTYKAYYLQIFPLSLSLLLTGFIHGFDLSVNHAFQIHDTYLILKGWAIFVTIWLIIGYAMYLLIVLITNFKKADYNILLFIYNTILMVLLGSWSFMLLRDLYHQPFLEETDSHGLQLVKSLFKEYLLKIILIEGLFLIVEVIIVLKLVKLKKDSLLITKP